jgi:translation initiation factor 3 subunit A
MEKSQREMEERLRSQVEKELREKLEREAQEKESREREQRERDEKVKALMKQEEDERRHYEEEKNRQKAEVSLQDEIFNRMERLRGEKEKNRCTNRRPEPPTDQPIPVDSFAPLA